MSRLYKELRGDSELWAKEQELDKLTLLIGNVNIAINEGKLSPQEGEKKLKELKVMEDEAKSGEIFERWQKAYKNAKS